MRHFIIETKLDTGRKYFRGLSVTARYVAERDLAKRTAHPGSTLAIESYPTVAVATAAIAAHNEPLPFTAPKAAPGLILTTAQADAAVHQWVGHVRNDQHHCAKCGKPERHPNHGFPDERTPLSKGMDAYDLGDDLDDNPYAADSPDATEWERGWRASERTEGGR